MKKDEIISRLRHIAEHAIHTVGEDPFVLSLDDGIALCEAADMLSMPESSKQLFDCLGNRQTITVKMGDNICTLYADQLIETIKGVIEKGNETLMVSINPNEGEKNE